MRGYELTLHEAGTNDDSNRDNDDDEGSVRVVTVERWLWRRDSEVDGGVVLVRRLWVMITVAEPRWGSRSGRSEVSDTKQLKEDELMLVKFNIENESTRILALTLGMKKLYDVSSDIWSSRHEHNQTSDDKTGAVTHRTLPGLSA
ncbi:hypothetical protein Tco_0375193 [Tanacetum coccineum]